MRKIKQYVMNIRMNRLEISTSLREAGFRATPGRIAVIGYLLEQVRPVGIEVIEKKFPKVNKVTLYRMMTDFVAAGLLEPNDLGHGHVDYEIAHRPHHHHAVCESCGIVEDVYPCDESCQFEKAVLKSSKLFKQIKKQQTVFFGVCKKCAK